MSDHPGPVHLECLQHLAARRDRRANGDQACVAEMNKAFKERHDFVVAGFNAIPGISCRPGAGTFYAFAEVEAPCSARHQGRQ